MSFIPEGAEWFLADIVKTINVEGNHETEVDVDLVLIRATGPAEAYEKALQYGKEREIAFINTDQKTVTIKFVGLRDLNVVHGQLEDGTELLFERHYPVSPQHLANFVTRVEELTVFVEDEVSTDEQTPRKRALREAST